VKSDAETLVEWLREGAAELEKAHRVLDDHDVPRSLPESNVECTLAARIALALDEGTSA
jgi:hypothetical protein